MRCGCSRTCSRVGPSTDLTLTLSTESHGKSLLEAIGNQGIINLAFDHLADNRAPENHEFRYTVANNYLQLSPESEATASRRPSKTANKGVFRAKPLYGELELLTRQAILASQSSVTLTWNGNGPLALSGWRCAHRDNPDFSSSVIISASYAS